MGKKDKKKTGKTRQDKYYYLAKEQGYRARASFKLIQLNKKYNFLSSARVCIDLCAAPGGWLQVCAKYMPVSSVIVGVDLVPIKPIKNVTTLTEDITTQKCRASLKKVLKTWKADIVLHDGSPNMGTAWVQDAYTQSELTLAALKLATDFLVAGGTFVTKVFRSNDYNSLNWVFSQLFKRVEATKPTASRHTSAEIYVICRGFLAPAVLDPRLLDPRHVFKEIDVASTSEKNPLNPKQKRHREGYDESITQSGLIFKQVSVYQFLTSPDPLPVLASNNKIAFDPETEQLKEDSRTTGEVTMALEDLKLCGKREFKLLLKWREYARKKLALIEKKPNQNQQKEEPQPLTEEEKEAALDQQLDEELSSVNQQEKRKKKKVREKMAKERERLRLQMVHKNDTPLTDSSGEGLFAISQLPDVNDLDDTDMPIEEDYDIINEDIHLDEDHQTTKKKVSQTELPAEADDPKIKKQAELWFKQKVFEGLEEDDDFMPPIKKASFNFNPEAYVPSDDEISGSEDEEDNDYGVPDEDDDPAKRRRHKKSNNDNANDNENDEDLPEEELVKRKVALLLEKQQERAKKNDGIDDIEVVPQDWSVQDSDADDDDEEEDDVDEEPEMASVGEETEKEPGADDDADGNDNEEEEGDDKKTKKKKKKKAKDEKLEIDRKAKTLAVGTLLLRKKTKNELIDSMYNRYAFNDKQLPKWFVEDEEKHFRAPLPVPNSKVEEMKERFGAINVRPIKKVVEAKARKKRRMVEKLDKVKNQAAGIAQNTELSDKDRLRAIEKLYKGTMKQNKRQGSVYVVAKKFKGGSARGSGSKGKNVKVVDRRLKKDKRSLLRIQKKEGKKSQRKNKGSSRGIKTKSKRS